MEGQLCKVWKGLHVVLKAALSRGPSCAHVLHGFCAPSNRELYKMEGFNAQAKPGTAMSYGVSCFATETGQACLASQLLASVPLHFVQHPGTGYGMRDIS